MTRFEKFSEFICEGLIYPLVAAFIATLCPLGALLVFNAELMWMVWVAFVVYIITGIWLVLLLICLTVTKIIERCENCEEIDRDGREHIIIEKKARNNR